MHDEQAQLSLFQYWNTTERPREIDALMKGWEEDTSFRYEAFTRETAANMIGDRLGQRVANAFLQCRPPAMQADVFRLSVLYEFGGVYIDADIGNLGKNDFLVCPAHRGLFYLRRSNIANDVMVINSRRDVTVGFALDRAIENIEKRAGGGVWKVTGPGILTAAYHELGRENDLFRGYLIETVENIRRYVKFRWDLPYKKEASHWTNIHENEMYY
jgi:mannosyltransferase OCH1-like enzyme